MSGDQVDSAGRTSLVPRKWATAKWLASTFLVILGIGLAAAGVVAVFTTNNSAGSAALLGIGVLLVLVVLIGDRLESLRYGGLEVVLRRKAGEAALRGEFQTAEVLERAADSISRRISRTARSYQSTRGGLPPGPQRTAKMEGIIAEARRDAYASDLNQDEVLGLLWTGSEGARVWALGVLQERPELATTRAVIEAVQRPDQMFDQYQALVLADRYLSLPSTRTWARERIGRAVRDHLDSGALGTDADSLNAADRVLQHAARHA